MVQYLKKSSPLFFASGDEDAFADRPGAPYDYAETIYRKLGFPDTQRLERPNGVPVPLSDGGKAIRELF